MTWTVKELMGFFEKYYGEKYSGPAMGVMAEYLDGRSADFLKATADVLTRRFSRSYGRAPCPAEIERHMDEIVNAMPRPRRISEPEAAPSDEDRAASIGILEEMKRRLRAGKASPLARSVAGALEGAL